MDKLEFKVVINLSGLLDDIREGVIDELDLHPTGAGANLVTNKMVLKALKGKAAVRKFAKEVMAEKINRAEQEALDKLLDEFVCEAASRIEELPVFDKDAEKVAKVEELKSLAKQLGFKVVNK